MVKSIGQTRDLDPAIRGTLVKDKFFVNLSPWVSSLQYRHEGLATFVSIVVILFRFLHVIFHSLFVLSNILELLCLLLPGEDGLPVPRVCDLGELLRPTLLCATAWLLGFELNVRVLDLLLILGTLVTVLH